MDHVRADRESEPPAGHGPQQPPAPGSSDAQNATGPRATPLRRMTPGLYHAFSTYRASFVRVETHVEELELGGGRRPNSCASNRSDGSSPPRNNDGDDDWELQILALPRMADREEEDDDEGGGGGVDEENSAGVHRERWSKLEADLVEEIGKGMGNTASAAAAAAAAETLDAETDPSDDTDGVNEAVERGGGKRGRGRPLLQRKRVNDVRSDELRALTQKAHALQLVLAVAVALTGVTVRSFQHSRLVRNLARVCQVLAPFCLTAGICLNSAGVWFMAKTSQNLRQDLLVFIGWLCYEIYGFSLWWVLSRFAAAHGSSLCDLVEYLPEKMMARIYRTAIVYAAACISSLVVPLVWVPLHGYRVYSRWCDALDFKRDICGSLEAVWGFSQVLWLSYTLATCLAFQIWCAYATCRIKIWTWKFATLVHRGRQSPSLPPSSTDPAASAACMANGKCVPPTGVVDRPSCRGDVQVEELVNEHIHLRYLLGRGAVAMNRLVTAPVVPLVIGFTMIFIGLMYNIRLGAGAVPALDMLYDVLINSLFGYTAFSILESMADVTRVSDRSLDLVNNGSIVDSGYGALSEEVRAVASYVRGTVSGYRIGTFRVGQLAGILYPGVVFLVTLLRLTLVEF